MATRGSSRWTVIDGLRMHELFWPADTGARAKPPIVLVHGLGMSGRYMAPTGDRLAPRFEVRAPDLPGFGRSQAPVHVYSIAEHAAALGAWLAAEGLDRPVLVGNSHGCQVIAALVACTPMIARGMVLGAPTVERGRRGMFGEIVRLVRDIPRERLALIPIVITDYLRAGPLRILSTLSGALADRIEDRLAGSNVPTVLVRGARDPIVSERWINFLAGTIHHASLATIARTGHAINFSTPDAFATIVADFADSLV